MKIQKKIGGGGVKGEGEGEVGFGVWVDVIEELKFLGKFTQKNQGGGVGLGGSGWGVRVDVNEELKFLQKIKKTKKLGGGPGG